MLRFQPFAALRPRPEQAREVSCVPYDVVDTREARALARGNPLSFMHVIRPDIDLPDETDHDDPVVYRTAAESFRRLQDGGVLVREARPGLFLYRQEADLLGKRVSQTGVVGCCHIDDYTGGVIKKHEKTRQDKEDDRTRHILALNANAEPVFFMYKDRPDLARLISDGVKADPLFDFTAPDGVRHSVWRASDTRAYVGAFASVACAYVADGHHRTASAARAGAERRAGNPRHNGREEYNWFLAVLFPSGSLTILPYHRLVADLNGLSAPDLLSRIDRAASVTPGAGDTPSGPGSVSMHVAGRWYGLTFPEPSIDRRDPIRSLDSVLLYERILAPILGVGDIRTDTRIDFVGGIRGPGELRRRVDSGAAAVAFSMFPTTIEQLIAIADAGEIMPPKSTWFEPKLRSGLLVHTLD